MPRTDDQISNLDAELDALATDSTTDEVYFATKDYDSDVVAASAARRTLSGGGGGGAVQSASVTLTDEQIKALPSSTVEVIPDPEANQIIVPLGGIMVVNASAGQYSNVTEAGNVNTASLSLVYGDDQGQATAFIDSTTMLTWPGVRATVISPASLAVMPQGSGEAVTTFGLTCIGLGVRVVAYNSGDYSGGGSGNTMKVTVVYTVLDV